MQINLINNYQIHKINKIIEKEEKEIVKRN
jgi:hypothetical protein